MGADRGPCLQHIRLLFHKTRYIYSLNASICAIEVPSEHTALRYYFLINGHLDLLLILNLKSQSTGVKIYFLYGLLVIPATLHIRLENNDSISIPFLHHHICYTTNSHHCSIAGIALRHVE
jgi:hypothetical protein